MKALISPNEVVIDPNTNVIIGERVAEISLTEFEVAPPFFWLDCASNVVADLFYYSPSSGKILPIPQPVPPELTDPVAETEQAP